MSGNNIALTINGRRVTTRAGTSILKAAQQAGIYIPFLCTHPDLVPLGNCHLCTVKVAGMTDLSLACETEAVQGIAVTTETPELQDRRREALAKILTEHPHACLDCWRRMSCSSTDICLRTASVQERCVVCAKNESCELKRLVDYIGVDRDIPYSPREHAVIRDNQFFERNYNLCVMCGRCVQMCRDVRGVGVYAFDNEENPTRVNTVKGGSVKDSGCKFCLACVEVCPTGALVDIEQPTHPADRKANVVPCSSACPACIDIPRYVNYIVQSKYSEALAVIREKVPFPGTLGRVCAHPCEQACRRSQLNDPISIKELKRVAADRGGDLWRQGSKLAKRSRKRVAVVGAGPAGLTAAFYLAKAGHSVTVFEALSQPGGMMRVGIPEYRLPRNILAAEIDVIREAGVKIKTNTKVESVDSLLEDGFRAVFVAVGAHQGIKLGCEGENLPGVIDGVTFLRQVNLGEKVNVGDRVAVIGGGNAAIDAARMVLRTGAKEVTIVYRRTRAEMPAAPEEIEDALDEGVKIDFMATPSRISESNGKLLLECVRTELAGLDASGRPRPNPIKGSEYTTDYDTIIVAIGQVPDVPAQFGLRTDPGDNIQVDPSSLQTNKEGVFAGGDAVSGAASVIEAIAMARQAASAIDRYLGGSGVIDETLVPAEQTSGCLGKDDGFADRRRLKTQLTPRNERLEGFAEARPALTPEGACMEAGRCLRCDLRLKISPVMQAPQDIVTYTYSIKVVRPRSGRFPAARLSAKSEGIEAAGRAGW